MSNNECEGNGGQQKMLYTLHEPGTIFTDFSDIERFDREFWEITKGLPIRTGSLTRLNSASFRLWRIGLTEENKPQIKALGDEFRRRDYIEMKNDSTIEGMETTNWSTMLRNSMARVMVHLAGEVLTALDGADREFHICELASGYGKTSISLASSLHAQGSDDLLSRMHFHFVDYSQEKLERTAYNLKPYRPAGIELAQQNDEQCLASATTAKFDIIFSLCHMHKKPFLGDLLEWIHERLAKKGAVISGDWHSSLSAHPRLLLRLLERIGAEPAKRRLLEDMFQNSLREPLPEMNAEESSAAIDHQEYWASVYNEILTSPSTKAMKSRHYVLSAFDTSKQRQELMEERGFTLDMDKIRKAFPSAKIHANPIHMIPETDRASVMIALKKRQTHPPG
ncbi:methyltransferase domain-containing protein [Candidatus Micrarchaeota archaeon]|nr:methyltransferase domain-containing protein [Candidatus Micrarchaeota archaeon]